MNLEHYAKKIPDAVRSQRLITLHDPIAKAIPVQVNKEMALLFEIWFMFIEPNGPKKYNCPVCLQNILSSFIEMKGVLIQLEHDYQLLNSVE